jgi:CheY-like chemotaxis protein
MSKDKQQNKEKKKGGEIRVLCIDDEPDMIQLIKDILIGEGYKFISASSGEEGLKIMQQTKPDVILLDLMMPSMDGWEVYHRIKADDELKDIPVIIVTVKGDRMEEVMARKVAGVDDFINKTFIITLRDSVRRVLHDKADVIVA